MGSLNMAQLIGNLGRDAELRYTSGGTAVATFNLATTETWNDKNGQKKEKTEWHRCVMWGKSAESVSEYLTKGKSVYVQGRIETRQWEDKDGNKRYTTEIRVDRLTLLGGGTGQRRDQAGDQRHDGGRRQTRREDAREPDRVDDEDFGDDPFNSPAPAGAAMTDDDIPF